MNALVGPSRVCFDAPVAVSQIRTFSSHEADASIVPYGKMAPAVTSPLWPSRVCLCAPVAVSQSRTVLSAEADASIVPFGEKATDVTGPLWPSRACKNEPQPCLIPLTLLINGSCCFCFSQNHFFISLSVGQNTSAAP